MHYKASWFCSLFHVCHLCDFRAIEQLELVLLAHKGNMHNKACWHEG